MGARVSFRRVVGRCASHSIERQFVFVGGDESTPNPTHLRAMRETPRTVRETLKRLAARPELSKIVLPALRIEVPTVPPFAQSISEYLRTRLGGEFVNVRALVLASLDHNAQGDADLESTISHFLVCRSVPRVGMKPWSPLVGSPGLCELQIESWKLQTLLHDVAIDIAMFRASSILARWYGDTLDRQRSFSQMKVRYVREHHGGRCLFGLLNANSGYVCLTGPIRSDVSSTFPITTYIREWIQFLGWLQKEDPVEWNRAVQLTRDVAFNAAKEVNAMIGARAGQVGKAIRSALEMLPPKTWYLAFIADRPSDHERRDSIASLFGRTEWGQNDWRFVDESHLEEFRAHRGFIDIFGPILIP